MHRAPSSRKRRSLLSGSVMCFVRVFGCVVVRGSCVVRVTCVLF